MTDKEALEVIQNRIADLVKNDEVKKQMVKMHQEGKSDDEIQKWLTFSAIGTLIGA